MSLHITLVTAFGIALLLRFRYGPQVIPYAGAAVYLVLFLWCPTGLSDGLFGWGGLAPSTPAAKVDHLADVVSFGLLFSALFALRGATSQRPD